MEGNNESLSNGTNVSIRSEIEYEKTFEILQTMIKDHNVLKNGYGIFQNFEKSRNFYLNFLKIIFTSGAEEQMRKLSASTLKIFLKKNWQDDNYITNEERLAIVNILLNNVSVQNYFVKNYIAKLLGLIAAKEFPHCYEGFIKVILENLSNSQDPIMIDTFLCILTNVLNECDDRSAIITGEMLPVVMNVFKASKENQKNREKCLKIICQLLNKLSYADGTDPDLISRNLDSNSLIEECLGLFTSIIISNPKFLFDIKKYTIRILDILVRDMPIYSSRFFIQLIEPAWRLIVLELSLYTENVIFNRNILYDEDETYKMEDENHIYTRGYESEEEDEKYGLEGLILELIDFAVDLLKRRNVMDALRNVLLTFLLCIKGYCLMPYNSMILWKNDPNLYITEEYDDENINTVRSKSLTLIKEISKELDDDSILGFIRIIISEFSEGIKISNYSEVIKLDDYNFITSYFEKMNSDKYSVFLRHESNLLILGTLAEDLVLLRDKNRISKEEINQLIGFLFNVISQPSKDTNILVGRALWCVSRLLSLVKQDENILKDIFEAASIALIHPNSDLSVCLVSAQCLSSICHKVQGKEFDNENLINNYIRLIKLLEECNEETLLIPIETIVALSKINKEKALYVPLNSSKFFVHLYSKYYNHPLIGVKILELIKFWCTDNRSAKVLISLFVPFAIIVFDEFFKTLGKPDQQFEEIKRTVMTEHGNANMDVKNSLDMLPNLIDIINILTKFCVATGDTNNLVWISLIVNVICDILCKTNDIQILQRGTSLLRFYIPLCKDIIESQHQQKHIIKAIMRFFDPTLLESGLLYLGNVIAQYFTHIERKIETFVLESIVKRVYKAKMPSIVQSLVLIFSRLINLYPQEIVSFLTNFQVENKVGLKILIDKWLLHQPLFRGNYFKNVSIKALTILYETKNEIVETLMVIGYDPSHSIASVEVNAPFKILSVLIRCLNNEILQERMKNEKNDYDNLDYDNNMYQDDEDYQDGMEQFDEQKEETTQDQNEDDKKLDINVDEFKNIEEEPRDYNSKLNFLNLQGRTGGLNNLETGSEIYLSEMLGFDYNDADAEEDDNCEEDLAYLNDIDTNYVLKDYLLNWFIKVKEKDPEYFSECLKFLPKNDKELFKSFNI